ncbi:hypothetical protein [Candidatus Magnetaquicoccus inordinatus]|uniref:hypothetical protein n=1 Tax=Candidatus Magnetaquicoccus inordinatus TaxID=2496818 RepID=UPI00102C6E72|nr:hypothetical protein [Candidatus Magnetaquicoccus inordinatus]
MARQEKTKTNLPNRCSRQAAKYTRTRVQISANSCILSRNFAVFFRASAFENQKIIMEVQEEIISSWWVQGKALLKMCGVSPEANA